MENEILKTKILDKVILLNKKELNIVFEKIKMIKMIKKNKIDKLNIKENTILN